jgi:uncharacterized membrane protein
LSVFYYFQAVAIITFVKKTKHMMKLLTYLAALTTTGLSAGLFFAWSFSVTPGLGKINDAAYIAAMQSMNREILNPVFFMVFLGPLLLLPLSSYLSYTSMSSVRFWLLIAAAATYVVGVFGITMAGNVPMNEALNVFDLGSASAQQIAAQRSLFEGRWVFLNNLRTSFAVISLILGLIAIILPEPK